MAQVQFYYGLSIILFIGSVLVGWYATSLKDDQDKQDNIEMKKDLKGIKEETKESKESLEILHAKVDQEKDNEAKIYIESAKFYIVHNPNEFTDNHSLGVVLKIFNKEVDQHIVVKGIYLTGTFIPSGDVPFGLGAFGADENGMLGLDNVIRWNPTKSKIVGEYHVRSGDKNNIASKQDFNIRLNEESYGAQFDYDVNILIDIDGKEPKIERRQGKTDGRLSRKEWREIEANSQ